MAIDNGLAAVGSVRQTGTEGGSLYTFDARPEAVGNRQLNKYKQPIARPRRYFGYNVDVDGQTLAASESDGESYAWPVNGAPTPLVNSSPNFRGVGDGISISDDYIAIGFEGQGLVRLYDKAGNLLLNLTAPPGSTNGFGLSVAIEDDLLVVGGAGPAGAYSVLVYSVQQLLVPEPCSLALICAALRSLLARRRSPAIR